MLSGQKSEFMKLALPHSKQKAELVQIPLGLGPKFKVFSLCLLPPLKKKRKEGKGGNSSQISPMQRSAKHYRRFEKEFSCIRLIVLCSVCTSH